MIIRIKEGYRPVFVGSKIVFGFQEDTFSIDNDFMLENFIKLLAEGHTLQYLYNHSGYSQDEIKDLIQQLNEIGILEDIEKYEEYQSIDEKRYKTNLQYFSTFADLRTSRYEYQKRINGATVFLIGAGGSILTALCLMGMGIKKLILLDYDRIEIGNLSRQLIYTEDDLGKYKTQAAKDVLSKINSTVEIETVNMKVVNASCLAPYIAKADIVINAIDTPPIHSARWVNYACMKQGKTLIQGGVSPQTILMDRFSPEIGCFDCYLLAALRNDPTLANQLNLVDQDINNTLDFNTSYAPNIALLAWAVATETSKLIAGYAEPLVHNKSMRINENTLDVKWINDHTKVEDCPSCSGKRDEDEPITLTSLIEYARDTNGQ